MDPATMMLAVKGGIALYQQVQGMSKKKEAEAAAQRAAAQMRSIKEKDVYGNLQVPTLGAELTRQANAQNTATAMGVLQSVGAIGVLGGVTNIANASTDKILQISAMLQNAEYEKDKFVFQQQQALENRNINRELQMAGMELRGAQSAVSEAKMMEQNAALLGAEAITGYATMKMKEAPLYDKGALGTGKLSTEEQSIVNKRLAEGGMKLEDLKNLSPEQYQSALEQGVIPASSANYEADLAAASVGAPAAFIDPEVARATTQYQVGSPTGEAGMVSRFPSAEQARLQVDENGLPLLGPYPRPVVKAPEMGSVSMFGLGSSTGEAGMVNRFPQSILGQAQVVGPNALSPRMPSLESSMVNRFPGMEYSRINRPQVDANGFPIFGPYPMSNNPMFPPF